MGYDQRIKYVFTFELNIAKYVNYIVAWWHMFVIKGKNLYNMVVS